MQLENDLARAGSGRRGAGVTNWDWARIVREHGPMAFETAWRVLGNASDTEDAVQDAFVDALRLQREGAVGNWGALLRHLAGRRALDLLRKRRVAARHAPATPFDTEPAAPRSARPDAAAVATEAAALLRQALARLSEREAEVFSLRYFGDLSNGEIAQALGLTTGAVAVALHKARARLQALLQTTEESP
jgi:RNA polymerase sigma-70 factor (ECF subfamily)